MANMKDVNRGIKSNFPQYEIQAFRGDCYVWFVFGVHQIDSLYVNPVTTSTNDLIDLCLEQIQDYLISNGMDV